MRDLKFLGQRGKVLTTLYFPLLFLFLPFSPHVPLKLQFFFTLSVSHLRFLFLFLPSQILYSPNLTIEEMHMSFYNYMILPSTICFWFLNTASQSSRILQAIGKSMLSPRSATTYFCDLGQILFKRKRTKMFYYKIQTHS